MRAGSSWSTVRVSDLQAPRRYALNGGPFGSKLVSNDHVPEGVPVIRGTNLPEHSRFSMNDFVFVSESKADELLPNNAHPGGLLYPAGYAWSNWPHTKNQSVPPFCNIPKPDEADS